MPDAADDTPIALLVIDVLNHFDHEDGEELLRAFSARAPAMRAALDEARRRAWPVVYANDDLCGAGDPEVVVRRALEGDGADVVTPLAPRPGEPVLLKPGYSACAGTDLPALLRHMGVEGVAVMGAVAEMCVLETAADALREGFGVTVLSDASVPLASDEARAALDRLQRQGAEVVGALAGDPGREPAWQPRRGAKA